MTYFTGRRAAMLMAAAARRPSFAGAVSSGLGNAEYWRRRHELRSSFTRDEDAFFAHFATQFLKFETRVAELTPDWPGDPAKRPIDYDTRVLAGALKSPGDAALDDVLWGLVQRRSLAPALLQLVESGYFCDAPSWASAAATDEDLARFERWARQVREAAVMPVFRKVVCPSCSATNMGLQENCVICNAPLPPEPVAAQPPAAEPAPAAVSASERLCAHCNARLPESVRFCVECGTPIDAVPQEPAAASACANCGAELTPSSRFCVNCGTPVSA
jgi:hypothetical protein